MGKRKVCPVCESPELTSDYLDAEWACGRRMRNGSTYIPCGNAEDVALGMRALCDRLRIDAGDDATEGWGKPRVKRGKHWGENITTRKGDWIVSDLCDTIGHWFRHSRGYFEKSAGFNEELAKRRASFEAKAAKGVV